MAETDAGPVGAGEDGVLAYELYFDDANDDLQSVRATCEECRAFIASVSAGYIWHLEAPSIFVNVPDSPSGLRAGLRRPMLLGSLSFGENVDDEWFCVWMLFALSRRLAGRGAVVRMEDTDGDFLLAEAADHLPHWVSPETVQNRVFVIDGRLCLIPWKPQVTSAEKKGIAVSDPITSAEAGAAFVRAHAGALVASAEVQRAVDARLDDFPGKALRLMHVARMFLPETAARVLAAVPQLVGAAVGAFYSRDAGEVLRAARMPHFPAAGAGARASSNAGVTSLLVPMSVPLTRHLYAQLRQQRYHPPKAYAACIPVHCRAAPRRSALDAATATVAASAASAGSSSVAAEAGAEMLQYELGCKLAAGLEILVARGGGAALIEAAIRREREVQAAAAAIAAAPVGVTTVPSGAIVVAAAAVGVATSPPAARLSAAQDPATHEIGNAAFRAYLAALAKRGYFDGARTPHDREAKERSARAYFDRTQAGRPGKAVELPSAAAATAKPVAAPMPASVSMASVEPPLLLHDHIAASGAGASARGSGGDVGGGAVSAASRSVASRLLMDPVTRGQLLERAGIPSVARAAGADVEKPAGYTWPPDASREDPCAWLHRGGGDDAGAPSLAEQAVMHAMDQALKAPPPVTTVAAAADAIQGFRADRSGERGGNASAAAGDGVAVAGEDMDELHRLLGAMSSFVRGSAGLDGVHSSSAARRGDEEGGTDPLGDDDDDECENGSDDATSSDDGGSAGGDETAVAVEDSAPATPSTATADETAPATQQTEPGVNRRRFDSKLFLSLLQQHLEAVASGTATKPTAEEMARWTPMDDGEMLSVGSDDDEDNADATNSHVAEKVSRSFKFAESSGGGGIAAGADGDFGSEPSLRDVMRAMDAELMGGADSTLRASFTTTKVDDEGEEEEEGVAPAGGGGRGVRRAQLSAADVRLNLLTNLARSVGGQAGAAGPASNMLAELGEATPVAWWQQQQQQQCGPPAAEEEEEGENGGGATASSSASLLPSAGALAPRDTDAAAGASSVPLSCSDSGLVTAAVANATEADEARARKEALIAALREWD